MTHFRSTRQVAAELGVPESVAHDAVRRRLIPEVPIIGHSRLWDAAAIQALRELIARRPRCPRRSPYCVGSPDGGSGVLPGPAPAPEGGRS